MNASSNPLRALEQLAQRVESLLTAWGELEESEKRDAIAADIRSLATALSQAGVVGPIEDVHGNSVKIGGEWMDYRDAGRVPAVTEGLDPHTADLVNRFAQAMAEKLKAAQDKYGYGHGWINDDWMDECREKLLEHVGKGDPRDVAAYCAFLWHHGERTAAAPAAQVADKEWSLHDRVEFALRDAGFDLDEAFKIAALAAAPAAQGEGCQTCEPDGIYATDGTGPWDCYACGKKAAAPPVVVYEAKVCLSEKAPLIQGEAKPPDADFWLDESHGAPTVVSAAQKKTGGYYGDYDDHTVPLYRQPAAAPAVVVDGARDLFAELDRLCNDYGNERFKTIRGYAGRRVGELMVDVITARNIMRAELAAALKQGVGE